MGRERVVSFVDNEIDRRVRENFFFDSSLVEPFRSSFDLDNYEVDFLRDYVDDVKGLYERTFGEDFKESILTIDRTRYIGLYLSSLLGVGVSCAVLPFSRIEEGVSSLALGAAIGFVFEKFSYTFSDLITPGPLKRKLRYVEKKRNVYRNCVVRKF